MKRLILITSLAFVSALSYSNEREYINCQSPSIYFAEKKFVFMNKNDSYKPDWKDLIVGTNTIGLYFLKPGSPEFIKDATIQIRNVVEINNSLMAIEYQIRTSSTPLAVEPFTGEPRRNAEGWVLCGDYGS